jgi:hypothetical protein
LGTAAQAAVAAQFTVERLCHDMEVLYAELLARKGIFISTPVLVQSEAR